MGLLMSGAGPRVGVKEFSKGRKEEWTEGLGKQKREKKEVNRLGKIGSAKSSSSQVADDSHLKWRVFI